jgi:diguanylate cyclase (GGDEF)-like protein/PAS domain S-box-containing protein
LRPILNENQGEESAHSKSRISEELESLRQRIADLQLLEYELSEAEVRRATLNAYGNARSSEDAKLEIETRLGSLPGFLSPAQDNPELLDQLWRQSRWWYYDSPMPERLRERLSAQLARYCPSHYALVVSACTLRSLGVPAGEILRLLSEPSPTDADVQRSVAALAGEPAQDGWPQPGSALEEALARCALYSFIEPDKAQRCVSELRRCLGMESYAQLAGFLAFTRFLHTWLVAHPEISYEADPQVRSHLARLIRDEPQLSELFKNHYYTFGHDRQAAQAERALRASEERYRELFENAYDIVYIHDLDGRLTSLNKAAERILGCSRTEALQMKFTDFIAPESLELARRMIDRQISGEPPATYELEILTRDNSRMALEISTRLIFREGRPVGVQGIARDISERKRAEEALQQANQKLEAWVQELEQRTREMALLSEMGDMLRACLTTDEAYTVIVRVAQQIFPVQVGALYVITSSRNLLEAVAIWGNSASVERVFAPEECWGLRRGRMHMVESTPVGLLCKHLHQPAPDSYLCVPMMAQSEALGVLHLAQSGAERLTEAKQKLAATMAEHIAMALSNLKLHETLRSQSIRDPLTGLFNRRFMEESLELELRRATRNQRSLGVIMLDLDHFKHFNDTYGHEAGDTLLREVGTLLQTNIRGEDIACRYGGEEFTLLLPEGTAEVTRNRAEFLREAIKRLDVKHRNQPLGRITASIGVAVFPEHGRTGEALLNAADAALYRGKDEGRDRVIVAK